MSKEEYSEKIRKWLNDKGCTPKESNTDGDSGFIFTFKDTTMSAGFIKDFHDSITVAWTVTFNEIEQKMIKYVKKNEILEMKKLLCQLHLVYDFTTKGESIEEIYICREIFFDVLTKDKFYDAVFDIHISS